MFQIKPITANTEHTSPNDGANEIPAEVHLFNQRNRVVTDAKMVKAVPATQKVQEVDFTADFLQGFKPNEIQEEFDFGHLPELSEDARASNNYADSGDSSQSDDS